MRTEKYERQRRKGALWLGAVWIALICSGCDRIWEWSLGPGHKLDKELGALEQSTRLVVNGGNAGLTELGTVTNRATIQDVVMFFERYPGGWVTFSAAPRDYYLYFYKDDQLLGLLGLAAGSRRPGDDTLSVGDYFRRAPASEVAALVQRLGLPWPPRRKSDGR